MVNPLVDLLFLSEKRKNILLLLMEGPKNIETIRETLKANATSVQPQIKKLKEQHLVTQKEDLYVLTDIGRIVVEKMKPLLDTLDLLEGNADYWANRDMTAIPPELLRRINELGQCTTTEPDIDRRFELIPLLVENMKKAKRVRALLSYFHPLFPSHYLDLARKGISVSLLIPEPILRRWVEDYRVETEELLSLENAELFTFKKNDKVPSLMVADNFMAMALFPKSAVFDRKYVMSFELAARVWGEEYIDHFQKLATQIGKLENSEETPGQEAV
jgi:predicted transcriptional regulator